MDADHGDVVMPQAQFGEQNGRAKLTDNEVDLIRALRSSDDPPPPGVKRFWTVANLADKFDVTPRTIYSILSGCHRP